MRPRSEIPELGLQQMNVGGRTIQPMDSGTYFSGTFPVVQTPQPSPLRFCGDLTTSLGTLTLALLPGLSLWVFWVYMV